MAKLRDVCRHVRSKNAGPFWITIDIFFPDRETYLRYRDSATLGPAVFASLYGANPSLVRNSPVDPLNVIKISFPRTSPQGGIVERDMHSGQQFARLLGIDIDP